jgi:quercetin dioxygenase-like cupin family protein
MPVMIDGSPTAIHRGVDELPWVDAGDGIGLRVLAVLEREGLWIVHNRFEPGVTIQRHKHTGPVYGYTYAGAWKYAEYDYVNVAGSFLYEPAGSVHTLTVPEDNTEITDVIFHMYGVNMNLDENDEVESVVDGPLTLLGYRALCEAAGLPDPPVLTD